MRIHSNKLDRQFMLNNKIALDEDQSHTVLYYGPETSAESLLLSQSVLGKELIFKPLSAEKINERLQLEFEKSARDAMDSSIDEFSSDDLESAFSPPEDLLTSTDDAPIIRMLNALFTESLRSGASDIHIEPYESSLRVRFRIDGVLKEVLKPSLSIVQPLVSRIKVMAKLDIAEKRLPQDGHLSIRLGERYIDVRVSTIPAANSERVVLRILDKSSIRLGLEQLGMASDTHDEFVSMIHRPHGIILVVGPTGSGKTTSLYAALGHLNHQDRNIMTIEDPIEYYIQGINQTQVNHRVDMSFALGLRAILRQDPDIIMIGEIRDKETLKIAIQASLTGHLVFATLHTNTAIGAINRLRDIGAEPFLLASSLIGSLAQRLVRRLCSACKQPCSIDDYTANLFNLTPSQKKIEVYRPGGCDACSDTGYSGRVGIYELISINQKLRDLIYSMGSEKEMIKEARKYSQSLMSSACKMALDGTTSFDEIVRILRD